MYDGMDDDATDGAGPIDASDALSSQPTSEYKRKMAEIDRLGDEIAVLSAQIQAATYELLVRLREFDQREGWGHHGAKSCAHWLAWRTSLDPGAAREWVRVARALEQLPVLSEAMRKGEVSYSKARALTRIATPETECRAGRARARGYRRSTSRRSCGRAGAMDPRRSATRSARLHDSRYRADLARRGRHGHPARAARTRGGSRRACGRSTPLSRRCTRSIGKTSRRPKRSGLPRHRRPRARPGPAPSRRAGSARRVGARRRARPGHGGRRYQVVVHVDAAVLADPAEQVFPASPDGRHVSAETSRRVACDAATVVMTHAADGSVLDVGRRTRTISPALRRALVERDGGCRFPGCGQSRCDAHHVKHWADGGETSLDNTLLLCRFHHRLVHEEGFQLHRLAEGEVEFRTPHGLLVPDAPAPPRQPIDPFEALVKRLEDGAIVVDPYTGTPLWDGSPPDLGLAVEWFLTRTAKHATAEKGDSDEPAR